MLNPTPPDRLVDARGRPYFLWDCDLTLADFQSKLEHPDEEVRAYLVGKLMRQAKPDDVFTFVSPRTIRSLWPRLLRYLGHTRRFWTWLFETWGRQGLVAEPAPSLEAAVVAPVGKNTVSLDSPHEILVNKLCALLSRAELRDLVDIRALLALGGELERAVADAPRRDAGFSPPTVAWLLSEMDPATMARALDLPGAEAAELVAFHRQLTERMAAIAAPE